MYSLPHCFMFDAHFERNLHLALPSCSHCICSLIYFCLQCRYYYHICLLPLSHPMWITVSFPATIWTLFFMYLASVHLMYLQMCIQSPWVMDAKFSSLDYIIHFLVLNIFVSATQMEWNGNCSLKCIVTKHVDTTLITTTVRILQTCM
jgi:hypothetical protein